MRLKNGGSDILGWGIAAVGAYLAYEYILAPMLGATTTPVTTGTTSTNPPVTGTTTSNNAFPVNYTPLTTTYNNYGDVPLPIPSPSANYSEIANTLVQEVPAGGGLFTYDQWNYYFNKHFGYFMQAAPGLNTTTTLITVGQFLSASGLSGLGLGTITTGSMLYGRLGGRSGVRPMAINRNGYMN